MGDTRENAIIAVVGSVATLLLGGTISGWSIAITRTGEVATAEAATSSALETGALELEAAAVEQRASLAWARTEGLLFTLAELPEECAARYPSP